MKRERFGMIPLWFAKLHLSGEVLRVAIALAGWANQEGVACVGYTALAKDTGITPPNVSRAIRQLLVAGFIVKSGTGSKRRTKYQIAINGPFNVINPDNIESDNIIKTDIIESDKEILSTSITSMLSTPITKVLSTSITQSYKSDSRSEFSQTRVPAQESQKTINDEPRRKDGKPLSPGQRAALGLPPRKEDPGETT
jgi:hypothetical protein